MDAIGLLLVPICEAVREVVAELKRSLTKTCGPPQLQLQLWSIIVIAFSVAFIAILGICLCLGLRNKSNRSKATAVPPGPGSLSLSNINQSHHHRHHAEKVERWEKGGNDSGEADRISTLSSPPPGVSHNIGWGHWFTLRDLQLATRHFSSENNIGDGGYAVVYHGTLPDGTRVAVKKLLNHQGQVDKEFRVEMEAMGNVRHKNLVRLLGYCMEGTQRMLVYEYVNNGNLEQWLHGDTRNQGHLTWEARIKIVVGTAKALAYLHESIEPKVVHRDIKSSNVLMDTNFEAKLSDFGLAKFLGDHESHVITQVLGTLGYVAPEYARSGSLSEKSDVYSFGVLLLECISGRYPVDYERPHDEVNMVEWVKTMVQQTRYEEVVDSQLGTKPSGHVLKRVLLTALRCVHPDAGCRPKMSQVAHMLEADEPKSMN